MRKINQENLAKMELFINEFVINHNGESPKLSEIMEYMNLCKATALRYMRILADKGSVIYTGKNSLEIPNQKKYKMNFKRVPIMGEIPCGSPDELCKEDIQGYRALPEEWIEGECYLLKAKGNSMVDIGIDNEDLVLIKMAKNAYDGQVVAVLTESGPTLKRYISKEGKRPYLLAENKEYPENEKYLYPQVIEIQGIALKVIKDIK